MEEEILYLENGRLVDADGWDMYHLWPNFESVEVAQAFLRTIGNFTPVETSPYEGA